jgi:hypothetical protein
MESEGKKTSVVSEMGAPKPYLHDHGILAGGNNAIWTPEDAWRDK